MMAVRHWFWRQRAADAEVVWLGCGPLPKDEDLSAVHLANAIDVTGGMLDENRTCRCVGHRAPSPVNPA
jgi:hypothetical protein